MGNRICVIEGCGKPVQSRGWCWRHYERWRKHGDPHGGRPKYASDSERLWAKTERVGECIIWRGNMKSNGYGIFAAQGKTFHAHRFAYEDKVGPIPAGLDLDHLCHTHDAECPGGNECPHRRCVNPDHLEPVTRKVNLNRGINGYSRRTHCVRNHAFDEVNTRWYKGRRWCRACEREREAHRDRKKVTP